MWVETASLHHALDKYVGLYRNQDREGYEEMFDLFEKWMNSDVPLAGQIFREVAQDIFQKNLLVQNRLRVGGAVVALPYLCSANQSRRMWKKVESPTSTRSACRVIAPRS